MRYPYLMNVRTTLMSDEQSQEKCRTIRVDPLSDQSNIAALLRRAFDAGRQEQIDGDFADLLARIN